MKIIVQTVKRFEFLVLLVVLISIPTILPLLHPGFFPTHDYIHIARVYELDKALKDGQLPVRWSPDFRYGDPTFNFYAPLAYYIGSLIHTLGLSFVDSTKAIFGAGLILSAVAMFFLGQELFGLTGGLIAAGLYTYAPYHSVDVYVRGALPESFALVFFPLIFLFAYRVTQQLNLRDSLFYILSLAGLFYTHNIMTLLFAPFLVGWLVFLSWQLKNVKLFIYLLGLSFVAFGLASSFLLPAFFEKQYVQTDKYTTVGYFDFRGHFVEIKQFFYSPWGYGVSLWGPHDGLSFEVGTIQWLALGGALLFGVMNRKKSTYLLLVFLVGEFLFSLFMQHNKSTPIWLLVPLLKYTQFPWRFLGISIFLIALIGASIEFDKKKLLNWLLAGGLIVGAFLININYFKPETYYPDSVDSHYVSAQALSVDANIPKDYLPNWAVPIGGQKFTQPQALVGTIQIEENNQRTTSAQYKINALTDSTVDLPITYFPGWVVDLDGVATNTLHISQLGLIEFNLPQGQHTITAQFQNTPIRNLGNGVTLVSLAILFIVFGLRKKLGNILEQL